MRMRRSDDPVLNVFGTWYAYTVNYILLSRTDGDSWMCMFVLRQIDRKHSDLAARQHVICITRAWKRLNPISVTVASKGMTERDRKYTRFVCKSRDSRKQVLQLVRVSVFPNADPLNEGISPSAARITNSWSSRSTIDF
ncbi:uncharacterized protein LOC124178065 [Neodiprion fabricii]|uniref:uncharacterized protein LOC124178065 n=1 Tax=Neodiprion fabricii TaxID=2872261 RepID=UPI001ED961EC|nr:uncharacterized protein LOC124178065 [Neodiprion fabricii]